MLDKPTIWWGNIIDMQHLTPYTLLLKKRTLINKKWKKINPIAIIQYSGRPSIRQVKSFILQAALFNYFCIIIYQNRLFTNFIHSRGIPYVPPVSIIKQAKASSAVGC